MLVAATVLATHWPALSAKALSFDDSEYLTVNRLVQNPSVRSAGRFLTEILEPSTIGGYYQPLAMISLMLDYASGGRIDHLRPFHRTSLALHVANSVLVIVLLYSLFGQPWVAAIVGLLFGVHPMTVESIPWVGERKTLLATCFALLSIISYVRYTRANRWRYYFGCLALYVLALMSKPTSLPLPAVILLMDGWPLRRLSWRSVAEKVPFFVIASVSAIITVVSQARTAAVAMPDERSAGKIILTLCHNIVFYPCKIVWPTNLTSHYAFPEPFDLSNPTLLASAIGTGLLIAALLISLRWTRSLLTGWLMFFIAIFPTMGVIGFTIVIASDKYAYLPSIGLMLPVAWFLTKGWNHDRPLPQKRLNQGVILTFALVLAAMEVSATRHYHGLWQDSETLYQHMMALAPRSAHVHNGLGLALVENDKFAEALYHYEQAIQINPQFVHPHYNLANLLYRQGKHDEAYTYYLRTTELDPTYHKAFNNLGGILLSKGKTDEAIANFTQALQYHRDYLDAHVNIGIALTRKGEIEKAIEHYKQALRLKSDCMYAHYNLANALAKKGDTDAAIAHYKAALQSDPDLAVGYARLGDALAAKQQLTEAIAAYREAVQRERTNADWYYTLGNLLAQQHATDEAIRQYQQALRIDPGHGKAREALMAILKRQK